MISIDPPKEAYVLVVKRVDERRSLICRQVNALTLSYIIGQERSINIVLNFLLLVYCRFHSVQTISRLAKLNGGEIL